MFEMSNLPKEFQNYVRNFEQNVCVRNFERNVRDFKQNVRDFEQNVRDFEQNVRDFEQNVLDLCTCICAVPCKSDMYISIAIETLEKLKSETKLNTYQGS